jgi:hypothetical protein
MQVRTYLDLERLKFIVLSFIDNDLSIQKTKLNNSIVDTGGPG